MRLWEGPNSLIKQMAEAGYNMVRVWGGGGLLPESFYEQCDQYGILVWQDLMYSGTVYPYNGFWKNKALTEAVSVWKQTRKHPCIALYCGNNEVEVALKHWGWDKTYGWDSADVAFMQNQYNTMFNEDLARIFEEVNANYLPSSPVSNWAPDAEMNRGDNHLWYVWHGERPLQDFDTKIPRFASEYGLPSWPSLECVRAHFGNDLISSRMLSYKGIKLLNGYMVTEFGAMPKDTLATILLSQYLQARALLRAYRAHSNDSNCGGSLYWQANDIWPGITWSTVDFMGNKKAAWYPLSRAFSGKNMLFHPELDKKYLKQVKYTVKRSGDYLEIKVGKEWLMGLMLLRDGKLLDVEGNVADLSPGATFKVLIPKNIGEIQIATAWSLLNNQGFLLK
jgi:beta-mannosidase